MIQSLFPVEVEIRRNGAPTPWDYPALDRRQREIADRVREGGSGALLLSEVSPIITVGRRTTPGDLLISEELLHARGIALSRTDRGGFATYHGPGQWVLFAVDRLDRLTGDPRGVRRAVDGLLAIAQRVGARYNSTAHRRDGAETGVWTNRGKFAAMGVHIEKGVLLHGLSINVFRTSESFFGLKPCGLEAPVDFLLESQGIPQDQKDQAFEELGRQLIEETFRIFWSREG